MTQENLNSDESVPSIISVDEEFIASKINELDQRMNAERDNLEVENDNWDKFDEEYENITKTYTDKIETVKKNAQLARGFKAQKGNGKNMDFL